ncbi:ABC transporter substrate-binding protein [Metabacillus rhizolycopersici]|uniref:ABC transporter substrate-binding protein n=1 Tax=Metabacillus rhizolycopersici TaxID=2875709 RepID=A0ABS7UQ75_9BACI|nr:ABC transporter substrate-binding protein [Metabacillus rhizolycopersici]MBZ5750100.1 ABC transporter substrate-binding protein [Metabacillus rhizolycopersici]
MKKKLLLGVGLAAMLALTACGTSTKTSSEEKQEPKSQYPLTIENYTKAEGGTTWEKKDQVFDKAPERVVANTRPAAELLLHLGLGDKIVGVGANFGAPDKAVEEEYEKLNILSDNYVGKEVTLGTNPGLVYGRGGLFDNADWGVGTVDSLNEMGVKTYILESSVTGGTYNSIYKDIENLGELFSVQDKANHFIKELKDRQDSITSKLSSIKEEKTFAYLHMSDPKELYVYPAHDETFFNDSFSMVKLNNIFADEAGEVSTEMLINADPDVLIIPNWGTYDGSSPDKIKEALYANEKLSSMKAIKNKQIFAVDYNYMFSYSYNTIDGMEMLAKEMYPDLFK